MASIHAKSNEFFDTSSSRIAASASCISYDVGAVHVRFFGDLLIRFLRHRTSSRRRSDGSWPRAIPICAPLEVDHVASSHARESVRRIDTRHQSVATEQHSYRTPFEPAANQLEKEVRGIGFKGQVTAIIRSFGFGDGVGRCSLCMPQAPLAWRLGLARVPSQVPGPIGLLELLLSAPFSITKKPRRSGA
jgi:hypothetical protein